MNGIINILKPTGMTSHDVVNSVRRILGIKKVGHAGTLDPNVAGVLVICVGKGTKFSQILMNGTKEYICELILGKSTDTQDRYGKITGESKLHLPDEQELMNVLEKFEGSIEQIPPAFSAVKLNGRKLYEYARENIKVEKPARTVDIKYIKLLKYDGNIALLKIKCSKGTYMRTLCNDIGKELGTLGHMGILVRTEAKGLHINNSVTLDMLKYLNDMGRLEECLISIDKMFPMESFTVNDKFYDRLVSGNEITTDTGALTDEKFYIYCRNVLIGIGHKTDVNKVKINKLLM